LALEFYESWLIGSVKLSFVFLQIPRVNTAKSPWRLRWQRLRRRFVTCGRICTLILPAIHMISMSWLGKPMGKSRRS